jgi:hypothetical protein
MRRRTVLAALGATTFGGCLSEAQQLGNQNTKTMTQQTPPECDSDLSLLTTDLDQKYTIKKETNERFSLKIEPASVNLGQDILIHLKNISSESQRTGSRYHCAIQKNDGGKWNHIFSTKENALLDSQAIDHDPNDGFTWEFTVSPIGFSIGPYYVCKELKPGKYRFVYFGLPDGAALENTCEISSE